MKTRYWKWIFGGRIAMVFRLKKGEFEMYARSRWQISDQYERAVQDPEFIEITKKEAEELIKIVGVQ